MLPRIRLRSIAGRESFQVSEAQFLIDEDRSWNDVLQLPRPEWLDIFQDFPAETGLKSTTARGTIIVSDDDDWLPLHIERLVAIVFVMGLDRNNWRIPADAFRYWSFEATSTPNQLVKLGTKTGVRIESNDSIQLFPPIELRAIERNYQVELNKETHKELVARFSANPHDRLATACYHLFRSQFEDSFMAPIGQDLASICACLEAAFNIEGPDYSKQLAQELQAIYGKSEDFARWIKGLYSERSVFNHGVSGRPDPNSEEPRQAAHAEFRQRSLSWDVARRMCLDVIGEKLLDSIDRRKRGNSRIFNNVSTLLGKLFLSEKCWDEVKKLAGQKQSVKKIRGLTGIQLKNYLDVCRSYLDNHQWVAMKGKSDIKFVYLVMEVMAAIVYEEASDAGESKLKAAAKSLHDAAKSKDLKAVKKWTLHNIDWRGGVQLVSVGEAARAVAFHTSEYFGEMNRY